MKTNDDCKKALVEEAEKALTAMEDNRELRLVLLAIGSGKLDRDMVQAIANQAGRAARRP